MIYQVTITTPAGQSASDPLRTRLPVTYGLVYKVEVFIRPGSHDCLNLKIMDGASQIWPSTPGEWFSEGGQKVSFDDVYLKTTPPYHFDIFTHNATGTYEHKATVRIGLVSKETFIARFMPTLTWEKIKETLDAMQKQQDTEQEHLYTKILNNPFTWTKSEESEENE